MPGAWAPAMRSSPTTPNGKVCASCRARAAATRGGRRASSGFASVRRLAIRSCSLGPTLRTKSSTSAWSRRARCCATCAGLLSTGRSSCPGRPSRPDSALATAERCGSRWRRRALPDRRPSAHAPLSLKPYKPRCARRAAGMASSKRCATPGDPQAPAAVPVCSTPSRRSPRRAERAGTRAVKSGT